MRRIILLVFWQFGLLAGGRLFADVVTLKDGRQISGVVESGNTQELHVKVRDQSQTIDIHQVQAIQFGVSLPAPTAAPPPPKAAVLPPKPRPDAAAPALGAGAGAAIDAAAGGGAAAAIRAGAVAGTFAGKLAGNGVKIAPGTAFANRLTQLAFIDSERGRQ
jgi:hypothetical protein